MNYMLENLRDEITKILLTEVKEIIMTARNENMIVAIEKGNGDSATTADVKIGELFSKILPELLPNSILINKEDFNQEVFEKMKTTKYIWVVDLINGTKAFRTPNNNKYCVGICLLDNLKPVLSLVYLPEYEFRGEKGLLFEAMDTEKGAKLNGRNILITDKDELSELSRIIMYKSHSYKNVSQEDERIDKI